MLPQFPARANQTFRQGDAVHPATCSSRYWFKGVTEEAHLLQIAGYPRGAKASKRIPVEAAKRGAGHWIGMTEEDLRIRRENNQHG